MTESISKNIVFYISVTFLLYFMKLKLLYIYSSILNVLLLKFVFLTGLLSDEFLWSRVADPGWDSLDPDPFQEPVPT